MFLKTVIEEITFPVINTVLDNEIELTTFTKIVIWGNSPTINLIGDQYLQGGDPKAAIKALLDFFVADFTPPASPLATKIAQLPSIVPEAFPHTQHWSLTWRFATSTPAGNDFWWIGLFDHGKINNGGYQLFYNMRYVRDAPSP